mmetsp:Transcript_18108/g.45049  ORF Transcript_18108/g.45049 Transcript_18108/m.45049 type:complete len:80 (+) Transcript_18108:1482-1721(+)
MAKSFYNIILSKERSFWKYQTATNDTSTAEETMQEPRTKEPTKVESQETREAPRTHAGAGHKKDARSASTSEASNKSKN